MNIYVASPYQLPSSMRETWEPWPTHTRTETVNWRAQAALKSAAILQYVAWMHKSPMFFYTPIGYEHFLINELVPVMPNRLEEFRHDGEYWMNVDRDILPSMDHIVVVAMPGWTLSTGVWEEVHHFQDKIGAKVILLDLSMEAQLPPGAATQYANRKFQANEHDRYVDMDGLIHKFTFEEVVLELLEATPS